jgi:outer membrane protein TolC
MNNYIYAVITVLLLTAPSLSAQQVVPLEQAVDMALQHNRSLQIKSLQTAEKQAKVQEDNIKKYPSVTVNSTYQYNPNLGVLTIPEGSFGSLPTGGTTVLLPNEAKSFQLGNHNTFNAGVTVYQPITQLGKIKAGVEVLRTDVLIAEQEKTKAALQVKQAVERLYYGILITRKQKEEAAAKMALAKIKLYDVESALLSGKTIDVNKAGLQANIADEEQDMLKLDIQEEDYRADLQQLTGLTADSMQVEMPATVLPATDATVNTSYNVDLRIAMLNRTKTEQAIKATRLNYLPDVGLIAGYSYQTGNLLYPTNNPFAGAQLKWDIQGLFANKQVLKQRHFLLQQAQENIENTQEQVNNDIAKARRKITQAAALIAVAQKVVNYRQEELKIQEDKQAAGLNIAADILDTRSSLAKATADLLSAQLNYRLAQSDLKILTNEN